MSHFTTAGTFKAEANMQINTFIVAPVRAIKCVFENTMVFTNELLAAGP